MIAMPDSVTVPDLPPGYPAYLGYADGRYANAQALIARFPAARHVLLTVTGGTLDATGIDCEPGNANAADTRVWVQRKLARDPRSRPVIYASVVGQPNYGMGDILAALKRNRIARASVRLLSAHYGQGNHICGPGSCGEIAADMDGTQWTNSYAAANGRFVDMSALRDDFFNPSSSQTEAIVRELGVVRQGDLNVIAVRTVQGLLCARSHPVAVDGIFGPATYHAVMSVQKSAGVAADGTVGPQTWPVLLGIAP